MPKLLVIDDDEALFELLQAFFKDEGFTAAHASDGQTGLLLAAQPDVDAVVLDVMLPGLNGFEVLKRLRATKTTERKPVLMLTARGEEVDKVVGLEMGADDYLPKPFSPRELVARLRALIRRAAPLTGTPPLPDVYNLDGLHINRAALSVVANAKHHNLTLPEMRLLDLLLEHPGQVVSRELLYRNIFNHPAYPMDRSLDMLVSRLRKKIGPRRDHSERIKAVRGEGYMYLLPEALPCP